MNAREACKESFEKLSAHLASFSPATHDPNDPRCPWNDIRLAAESLAFDFRSSLIMQGSIELTLRREVADLLLRAVDMMPMDVDPHVIEKMQSDIAEVLLAQGDEEDQ